MSKKKTADNNKMMAASIGKNSNSGNVLKQYIERIEQLNSEKQDIADNISDAFKEAKDNGFDTKIMRLIISIRKMDPARRAEQEEVLKLYMHAIGMENVIDE